MSIRLNNCSGIMITIVVRFTEEPEWRHRCFNKLTMPSQSHWRTVTSVLSSYISLRLNWKLHQNWIVVMHHSKVYHSACWTAVILTVLVSQQYKLTARDPVFHTSLELEPSETTSRCSRCPKKTVAGRKKRSIAINQWRITGVCCCPSGPVGL